MGGDSERLVAEIPADLKARVKADPRDIREVVESALQREFMTGATAAVERRIEEKRTNINRLEKERNERNLELAKEQDELERLESQLDAHESTRSEELEKALDNIDTIPEDRRDASNPAIENQAEKLGMTPEELFNEYTDR